MPFITSICGACHSYIVSLAIRTVTISLLIKIFSLGWRASYSSTCSRPELSWIASSFNPLPSSNQSLSLMSIPVIVDILGIRLKMPSLRWMSIWRLYSEKMYYTKYQTSVYDPNQIISLLHVWLHSTSSISIRSSCKQQKKPNDDDDDNGNTVGFMCNK